VRGTIWCSRFGSRTGRRRAWSFPRVGRFEAQAKLPFEGPPGTANGSRIVLSRADKPMLGVTVALDVPDHSKIELTADAAGMIETGIA